MDARPEDESFWSTNHHHSPRHSIPPNSTMQSTLWVGVVSVVIALWWWWSRPSRQVAELDRGAMAQARVARLAAASHNVTLDTTTSRSGVAKGTNAQDIASPREKSEGPKKRLVKEEDRHTAATRAQSKARAGKQEEEEDRRAVAQARLARLAAASHSEALETTTSSSGGAKGTNTQSIAWTQDKPEGSPKQKQLVEEEDRHTTATRAQSKASAGKQEEEEDRHAVAQARLVRLAAASHSETLDSTTSRSGGAKGTNAQNIAWTQDKPEGSPKPKQLVEEEDRHTTATRAQSKASAGNQEDEASSKPGVDNRKKPPSFLDSVSSMDGNSPSIRTKKARSPPPPQLLCEALQTIFQCAVTVAPGPGTWGGQDWFPASAKLDSYQVHNSSSKKKIVLTLHPHCKTKQGDMKDEDNHEGFVDAWNQEWKLLVECFPLVWKESHADTAVWRDYRRRPHLIVEAASCHTRAQTVIREGYDHAYFYHGKNKGVGNEWRHDLATCLYHAKAMTLVAPVVEVLAEDCSTSTEAGDDPVSDLFSDEYNNVTETRGGDPVGIRKELLLLLEETIAVIQPAFLQDLTDAFSAHSNHDLSAVLLQDVLQRLARTEMTRDLTFSSGTVNRRLTAVSNLFAMSKDVGRALADRMMNQELIQSVAEMTGRELEQHVWLGRLFQLAAYVVPEAGDENALDRRSYPFLRQLEDGLRDSNFPLCIFEPQSRQSKAANSPRSYLEIIQDAQRTMSMARQAAESALRIAFRDGQKQNVFDWLAQIARANGAMATLTRPDLLAVDGMAGTCASRSFLLGASSAVVGFCNTDNLFTCFEKLGHNAFDARYLSEKADGGKLGFGCSGNGNEHGSPALLSSTVSATEKTTSKVTTMKFTGATEFFFIASAFLRVSLYPVMRMEDEFRQLHGKFLAQLRESEVHSPVMLEQAKPRVSALLGFQAVLTDRESVQIRNNFTLLQLEWLLSVLKKGDNVTKAQIPDWILKEPARWLSYVARHFGDQLQPHQADKAVEFCTQLLQIGTNTEEISDSKSIGASPSVFSPTVATALVRILSSFVSSGVDRARARKRHTGKRPADNADEPEDDRDLNIYHSLDRNDLGVAVFTNDYVCTQLCPTLMQAFCSLDIIEGLDVDREHSFDKFMVKVEIADLFLRLWSHPDGRCRNSVLQLPPAAVEQFGSSLSAAIGYILDDACLRLTDVVKYAKQPEKEFRSQKDVEFNNYQTGNAVSQFFSSRRLLVLLVELSKEKKLASFLGRGQKTATVTHSSAADLAIMVVHFLDLVTTAEGATDPDIDFRQQAESSSSLLDRLSTMPASEKQTNAFSVTTSRFIARTGFGLDISILCHQLLALASTWHLSALDEGSMSRESSLLLALASHDDCDVERYTRILERMIDLPGTPLHGTEADNAAVIFKHDGYVDCSNYAYESLKLSETQENHRRLARQDQMEHSQLSAVASKEEIFVFLSDLKRLVEKKTASDKASAMSVEQYTAIEQKVLTGNVMSEDRYGEILAEWVVSSAPFANQTGAASSFLHYYNATIRTHGAFASGKTLVHEARRCHKTLPVPHSNAASFVCYAEERMDLCRAVITGPVDTPYAFGIFVFDIYYPMNYPQIPPLVNFMTTGGGQTRFGPNLYQDGKVCLSLLGTFHAADDSERWNPKQSSLAQILLSIQTQLLVKEPVYNEPRVEQMQGTKAGRDASTRYNNNLRLETLRHAIVGNLRHPVLGFEEVGRRHFSMCRKRIIVQARRWMLEAKGTPLYKRFEKVYAELLHLLSAEDLQTYDSLPPLADDLQALRRLDPTFLQLLQEGSRVNDEEQKPRAVMSPPLDDDDRKPSARPPQLEPPVNSNDVHPVPSVSEGQISVANPWAAATSAFASLVPASQGTNDDSDEEMYW